MSVIATALKHLIAAGVTGDDLVRAVAEMEAQYAVAGSTRTARQDRNARYYAKKASEKRLNSDFQDNSDVSDGVDNLSSPEVSPHTPLPKPLQSIPPSPPKGGSSPTDQAIEVFTEQASKAGISVPRKVTADRRRKIEARLREHGADVWAEACRRMASSAFCRGENDRGWRADLDFLCQPKSFNGLIEGKYDDRPRQPSQAPPGKSAFQQRQDEIYRNLQRDTGDRDDEFTGTTLDIGPRDFRAH